MKPPQNLARVILFFALAAPLYAQMFGPFDVTQAVPTGSAPVTEQKLSDRELQERIQGFLKSVDSGDLVVTSSDRAGSFDFQLHKTATKVELVDQSVSANFLMGDLLRLPDDLNECQINIGNLAAGLQFWRDDHADAVPDGLNVLVSDYLHHLPICPVEGASAYLFERDGADFELVCPNAHPSAPPGVPGPRWQNQTMTLVVDSRKLLSDAGSKTSSKKTTALANGTDSNQTGDAMPTSAELLEGVENRHPIEYMLLASLLMQEKREDEAVFWFYAGQLRYRYYRAAGFGDPEEGSLGAAMLQSVGSVVNAYAFGDLPKLRQTLDEVIAWDETTPNAFSPESKTAPTRQEVLDGLQKLRQETIDSAEDIRAERVKNGLENRN